MKEQARPNMRTDKNSSNSQTWTASAASAPSANRRTKQLLSGVAAGMGMVVVAGAGAYHTGVTGLRMDFSNNYGNKNGGNNYGNNNGGNNGYTGGYNYQNNMMQHPQVFQQQQYGQQPQYVQQQYRQQQSGQPQQHCGQQYPQFQQNNGHGYVNNNMAPGGMTNSHIKGPENKNIEGDMPGNVSDTELSSGGEGRMSCEDKSQGNSEDAETEWAKKTKDSEAFHPTNQMNGDSFFGNANGLFSTAPQQQQQQQQPQPFPNCNNVPMYDKYQYNSVSKNQQQGMQQPYQFSGQQQQLMPNQQPYYNCGPGNYLNQNPYQNQNQIPNGCYAPQQQGGNMFPNFNFMPMTMFSPPDDKYHGSKTKKGIFGKVGNSALKAQYEGFFNTFWKKHVVTNQDLQDFGSFEAACSFRTRMRRGKKVGEKRNACILEKFFWEKVQPVLHSKAVFGFQEAVLSASLRSKSCTSHLQRAFDLQPVLVFSEVDIVWCLGEEDCSREKSDKVYFSAHDGFLWHMMAFPDSMKYQNNEASDKSRVLMSIPREFAEKSFLARFSGSEKEGDKRGELLSAYNQARDAFRSRDEMFEKVDLLF